MVTVRSTEAREIRISRLAVAGLLASLLVLGQPSVVHCASASSASNGPSIMIVRPSEGDVLRGRFVLEGNAEENATVSLSLDGGTTWVDLGVSSSFRYHWATYAMTNGPARLMARAMDDAGRQTTVALNVTIDTLPFELSIDEPRNATDVRSPAIVKGHFRDPNCDWDCWGGRIEWSAWPSAGWVDVGVITRRVGRGSSLTYWEFPISAWRDEAVQIHVRLVHVGGEVARDARGFYLVKSEPDVRSGLAVLSPTAGATVAGVVTLRGRVEDVDGNWIPAPVDVSLDGTATWSRAVGTREWSYQLDTRALPNGLLEIWVRTMDRPGEFSTTHRLHVANPAPNATSVQLIAPKLGAAVSGVFRASGTAMPGADRTILLVEAKLDAAPWERAAGTSSWEVDLDATSLAPGEHDLWVRAYDGFALSPSFSVPLTIVAPAWVTTSTVVAQTSSGTNDVDAAHDEEDLEAVAPDPEPAHSDAAQAPEQIAAASDADSDLVAGEDERRGEREAATLVTAGTDGEARVEETTSGGAGKAADDAEVAATPVCGRGTPSFASLPEPLVARVPLASQRRARRVVATALRGADAVCASSAHRASRRARKGQSF